MKKVLIIEDNRSEVEALTKVVHKIDSSIEILTTDHLGTAIQYAIQNTITLFIVDIILNPKISMDTSGLDFVETIRKLPQYKYAPIIFVTGLEDRRLYAYEGLHCYQYIQKPLLYSEVEKIVKEALTFPGVDKSIDTLKLKQDGILYVIQIQDIIYAFSEASRMTIVTVRERFHFYYLTCRLLMEKIQDDYFVKCNRSTIVNGKYIKSIDYRKGLIELAGVEEKVKIGKLYRNEFVKGFYENNGMSFNSK